MRPAHGVGRGEARDRLERFFRSVAPERESWPPLFRKLYAPYLDDPSRCGALLGEAAYLLDRLGGPGGRLLDTGCGFGVLSSLLALLGAGRVVGLDPVAMKVERASAIARALGVKNARFVRADGCRMGIGDGRFDAILAREMVSHVPDVRDFLRECRRVLRPGGVLHVRDYNNALSPRHKRIRRKIWEGVEVRHEGWVGHARPFREVRQERIRAAFPDWSDDLLDRAVEETRGYYGRGLLEAARRVRDGESVPPPEFPYRDPVSGAAAERDFVPGRLAGTLRALGFRARVLGPWHVSARPGIAGAAARLRNRLVAWLHPWSSSFTPLFEVRAVKLVAGHDGTPPVAMAGDVDLADPAGGAVHFRELAAALARRGTGVIAFVPRRGAAPIPGVEVREVFAPQIRGLGPFLNRLALPWCLLGCRLRDGVRVLYERELTHAWTLPLACKLFGLRRIVEVNGILEQEIGPGRSALWHRFHRLRQRWAFRSADRVVAVSEGVREWLARDRGVPEGRILLVENGADLERFTPDGGDPEEARRLLGEPSEGQVVGFLGTLAPYQGGETFLDAVAGLAKGRPGLCAWIVGSGPARGDWEVRARALGISDRVRWFGRVPYAAAPRFYRAFDLLAIPTPDPIRLPLKLAEGLASGTPVVAAGFARRTRIPLSDCPAIRIFPSGDADALATAIGELLDADRPALSESARTLAEAHFSWDRAAAQVAAIL